MAIHAIRSFGLVLPADGFAQSGFFARAGILAHAGAGQCAQRLGLWRAAWPSFPCVEALDDHSLFWSRRIGRAHSRTHAAGKTVRLVGGTIGGLGIDGTRAICASLFSSNSEL